MENSQYLFAAHIENQKLPINFMMLLKMQMP